MFWNRKTNKSPAVGQVSNPLPKPADLGSEAPWPGSEPPPHQNLPGAVEEDTSQTPFSQVVAAVSNPHDAAVNEVHAKLLHVGQVSAPRISDPLAEAPTSSAPQPFFDPATGAQRGVLEPIFAGGGGSGDSEQLQEETYGHLARIRELQREIATMHMHMEEGVGEGSDLLDIEVDVDADTVPTQEEEKAAKREREFTRLPGRFKGRSDNIDAMMAKLDDLSQAVTALHAIQPPPLNLDSVSSTRENTRPDVPRPPGEHTNPITARARQGVPPAAQLGSGHRTQIAKVLHDSPISTHAPLQQDVPTNR